MQVILIHNPDAGDKQQPGGDEIVELIRRAGHTVSYHSAKDKNWQAALQAPADLVAVAGGDGIVGKVAIKLVGRDVPIAVLPLGTANNIANTLELVGKPLAELIAGWSAARRQRFNVGVATGPWGSRRFIEGVGVGLFTETMFRLDATGNIDLAHAADSQEKITSVLKMLEERARRYPAKKLKLTIDSKDRSGEYILLEVMNIRSVGPNLYLAPQADPSDGLFNIVSVSGAERDKLSGYLSECGQGRTCATDLTAYEGRHVRLQWEWFPVHIDDEAWPGSESAIPASSSPIDITFDAATLEFLVPA